MREIKFRAWVVDEYQEDGNTPKSFKMLNWFPDFFSDMSPVTSYGTTISEDVILMQSIGLKDKNGKDIYEGDILKHISGLLYRVDFDEENCRYIFNLIDSKCDFNHMEPERSKELWYEVVGNIYEKKKNK
jgi:uncharacterized phage protein (TIGR01671 family)